ncbi:MAG: hypothetical protein AB1791_04870 [Chloroflexota bacterium]
METQEPITTAAGVSNEAVQAKTGKGWAEWFTILDAAGAMTLSHKEMAVYLSQAHQLDGWWSQMITVGYEQARGRREKHERPGGYQISVSKTLAVPVATLYEAWADETTRGRWLPDPAITIRKATPTKSLRATWVDGQTNLEVNFYAKGENKSQVVVQHDKLPDAETAAHKKAYWSAALAHLQEVVAVTHLLRSPENAARLAAALERATQGELTPQSLEELRHEVGLAED